MPTGEPAPAVSQHGAILQPLWCHWSRSRPQRLEVVSEQERKDKLSVMALSLVTEEQSQVILEQMVTDSFWGSSSSSSPASGGQELA